MRRWHERQALYETEHVCLFNPDLLRLPVPVPIEAFAACGHIVPSLRAEMASFVDEALEERGLQRRVVATTTQFMAIPMMLKQAPVIATLQARIAHYCANAAAWRPAPALFVADLDRLHGLASARRRIAVDRLAARPHPRAASSPAPLNLPVASARNMAVPHRSAGEDQAAAKAPSPVILRVELTAAVLDSRTV